MLAAGSAPCYWGTKLAGGRAGVGRQGYCSGRHEEQRSHGQRQTPAPLDTAVRFTAAGGQEWLGHGRGKGPGSSESYLDQQSSLAQTKRPQYVLPDSWYLKSKCGHGIVTPPSVHMENTQQHNSGNVTLMRPPGCKHTHPYIKAISSTLVTQYRFKPQRTLSKTSLQNMDLRS